MMRSLIYLLVVFGIQFAAGDYARYAEFVQQQAKNETFVRLFQEHLKLFEDTSQGKLKKADAKFQCQPFPQPAGKKTTSVHDLRPMDVTVVGALGDSITAGTGIKAGTVVGLLKEDRGLSWSVGGDKDIAEEETVPNMLKVYSPNVKGYSTGWGPVWIESSSRFNVANPGDKSEDMPGQAVKLVDRMKKDSSINFDDDWKVITLFVGGNDLCSFCDDKVKYSAENYVAHIKEALDHLHANVPRAYINLVEILDIAIVKTLNANFVCDTLHLFLCNCAAFPKDSDAEKEMQAETERYRDLMNQLVDTGRYDTRDDFTVVVQPFFRKTDPPKKEGTDEPDLSYFAPDCFHLSLKGHRAAADALWNNMIEPVGKKRTVWSPGETVKCPSETAPYFFTYKNSASAYSSSNGLGAAPPQDKSEDSNPNNGQSAQSSPIATVAIVIGVLAGIVMATVGVVVWRRAYRNKSESHIFLRPAFGHRSGYTSI